MSDKITINQDGQEVSLMSFDEAMETSKEIIEKVVRFWSKQSIKTPEDMDKLTSRLYGILKMDHGKFAATYPILLLMMARNIIDVECLRVHFKDVEKKGSIGNDDEQIDRVARYMAYASAAIARRKDPSVNIRKSAVKKQKREYAQILKDEKNKMKEAMESLKNDREKSRDEAHVNKQSEPSDDDKKMDELRADLLSLL